MRMRKTYQALSVVAALGIVAGALSPWFTSGPLANTLLRQGPNGPFISPLAFLTVASAPLLLNALVAGAMTFALVVAAWSHRWQWLVALAVLTLLAVVGPLLVFVPPLGDISRWLFHYEAGYPPSYQAGYLYSLLAAQAAPAVIACILALVFALTGLSRAGVAESA